MITINLLPESYRKSKVSSIQQLPRSPLALLTVVALAVLTGLLGAGLLMRQARLAQLSYTLKQLEPQKASVDELKAKVQALREQMALFQMLSDKRSPWARRLNRLSTATPDGIWFTELALDSVRGLVIQGSAMGQGGEETVRIGRLVQQLKADPEFSSGVQDIQIESIKSVQEKELEIVEFTLTGKLGAQTNSQASSPAS